MKMLKTLALAIIVTLTTSIVEVAAGPMVARSSVRHKKLVKRAPIKPAPVKHKK